MDFFHHVFCTADDIEGRILFFFHHVFTVLGMIREMAYSFVYSVDYKPDCAAPRVCPAFIASLNWSSLRHVHSVSAYSAHVCQQSYPITSACSLSYVNSRYVKIESVADQDHYDSSIDGGIPSLLNHIHAIGADMILSFRI